MDSIRTYLQRFSYKPQGRVFTFLFLSGTFTALGLTAPNWDIPKAREAAIGFFFFGGLSAIVADRCIAEDREEMAIAEIYKESRAMYAVDILTSQEEAEAQANHAQTFANPESKTQLQPEPETPPIFYYN